VPGYAAPAIAACSARRRAVSAKRCKSNSTLVLHSDGAQIFVFF
jgi:hypothetical protein